MTTQLIDVPIKNVDIVWVCFLIKLSALKFFLLLLLKHIFETDSYTASKW